MCTTTIPLRGARALIGHVAQNLLFLLNLFVQIEQIKNPISVLVLMRKSRRSRNFFVQPAQKFSTMLITFVHIDQTPRICATCTKIFNIVDSFCAKRRKLFRQHAQIAMKFLYTLTNRIFLCNLHKNYQHYCADRRWSEATCTKNFPSICALCE